MLVIDQNFDIGGRMMHSNGWVSYGGGDAIQQRDAKGESDPEGFIKVKPLREPEELTEDPDYLFRDVADWSIVDPGGYSSYRYNDRELHRGSARQRPGRPEIPDREPRAVHPHHGHPHHGGV